MLTFVPSSRAMLFDSKLFILVNNRLAARKSEASSRVWLKMAVCLLVCARSNGQFVTRSAHSILRVCWLAAVYSLRLPIPTQSQLAVCRTVCPNKPQMAKWLPPPLARHQLSERGWGCFAGNNQPSKQFGPFCEGKFLERRALLMRCYKWKWTQHTQTHSALPSFRASCCLPLALALAIGVRLFTGIPAAGCKWQWLWSRRADLLLPKCSA